MQLQTVHQEQNQVRIADRPVQSVDRARLPVPRRGVLRSQNAALHTHRTDHVHSPGGQQYLQLYQHVSWMSSFVRVSKVGF